MPPAPAASPTRGSGSANLACSEAMMMSQASAISKPPPMATPLTAAITGLSRSWRLVSPPKPLGGLCGRSPVLALQLGVILEVVAGAERLVAGAGDDGDPQVGVGGELVEGIRQLLVRHRVQRVVDLGTIDGDDQQVAVGLDLAVLAHGHFLPRGCCTRTPRLGGCACQARRPAMPDDGSKAGRCKGAGVWIARQRAREGARSRRQCETAHSNCNCEQVKSTVYNRKQIVNY